MRDQDFLFVDAGIGNWIFRDNSNNRSISGIAWTVEMHWSRSIGPADRVTAGNFVVGDSTAQMDLLNATAGVHIQIGQMTTATLGYSLPVTSSDRVFDGEARFFVNRNF